MEENNLLNDMPRTQERLRVSRTTLYNEINAGRLRVVKLGRRSFVTEEELVRYVAALPTRNVTEGGDD